MKQELDLQTKKEKVKDILPLDSNTKLIKNSLEIPAISKESIEFQTQPNIQVPFVIYTVVAAAFITVLVSIVNNLFQNSRLKKQQEHDLKKLRYELEAENKRQSQKLAHDSKIRNSEVFREKKDELYLLIVNFSTCSLRIAGLYVGFIEDKVTEPEFIKRIHEQSNKVKEVQPRISFLINLYFKSLINDYTLIQEKSQWLLATYEVYLTEKNKVDDHRNKFINSITEQSQNINNEIKTFQDELARITD